MQAPYATARRFGYSSGHRPLDRLPDVLSRLDRSRSSRRTSTASTRASAPVFGQIAICMGAASFANSRLGARARHAAAVPWGPGRLRRGVRSLLLLVALISAEGRRCLIFCLDHGGGAFPAQPDDAELQRHGDGAARRGGRHRLLVHRRLHDAGRRDRRPRRRPALRRNGHPARDRLCGFGLATLGVVLWTERGRLFAPHHPDPAPEQIAHAVPAQASAPTPSAGYRITESRQPRRSLQLSRFPEGTRLWKVPSRRSMPRCRSGRGDLDRWRAVLEAAISSPSSWPIASAAPR